MLFKFFRVAQVILAYRAAPAVFAKKPGRLNQFLEFFGMGLNISLFLQRAQGFVFDTAHGFIPFSSLRFYVYMACISANHIFFNAIVVFFYGIGRRVRDFAYRTEKIFALGVFYQNECIIICSGHFIFLHQEFCSSSMFSEIWRSIISFFLPNHVFKFV